MSHDQESTDDGSAREAARPQGQERSRVATLGFGLAVLAALAAALSGLGARWGWWDFRVGFGILEWAAHGAVAAAVVSLIGVILARPAGHPRSGSRRRGLGLAALGLVIALVTAYVPWHWRRTADGVPPIHDITTDLEDPPAFQAVLPLRADAANPSEYGGDSIAVQQRKGYPDIGPVVIDLPPDRAFDRALETARGMGWEIVAAEPAEGRIEATVTTFWYGFKDDVVVRVSPADGGSRIDVRSVSRVGRSDVGTNAARIRNYLAKVAGGVAPDGRG